MPVKVREIAEYLEGKYPICLAEGYDNPGLILGDMESEINGVLIALELNEKTIDEAYEKGCNLIITHHPFIFKAIKKVTMNDPKGRMIIKMIQKGINNLVLHTNYDSAADGMNDAIAASLGLSSIKTLCIDSKSESYSEAGIGRYGELDKEFSLSEFAELVKSKLNIQNIRVSGALNKRVRRIAVIGGSGESYIKYAFEKGCDAVVTGDMEHHQALDWIDTGIAVIDAGHYGSEKIFMQEMCNIINSKFNINCIITEVNTDPFIYL